MLVVKNNHTLVTLANSETNLSNGLKINNETQNRKDIVSGFVVTSTVGMYYQGLKVFFPLYASSMVNYNGVNYYIIHNDDILAVEGKDDSRTIG